MVLHVPPSSKCSTCEESDIISPVKDLKERRREFPLNILNRLREFVRKRSAFKKKAEKDELKFALEVARQADLQGKYRLQYVITKVMKTEPDNIFAQHCTRDLHNRYWRAVCFF